MKRIEYQSAHRAEGGLLYMRQVEGVAELQIFGLGVLACRPVWQEDSVVGLRFCASSAAVARILGGFSGSYADAS